MVKLYKSSHKLTSCFF